MTKKPENATKPEQEIPIPEQAPNPPSPNKLPEIRAKAKIGKFKSSEVDQACSTDENEPLGQPPACDPEGKGEDVN